MRTTVFGIALLHFLLMGVLEAQQTNNTCSTPIPSSVAVMAIGPDANLYVGVDNALYKYDVSDPTVCPKLVWMVPLGQGQATLPTGMCFHPQLGVIIQLGPDGSLNDKHVTDPNRWVTISLDSTNVVYHTIADSNGVEFGGGSCAVTSDGNIYLSSTDEGTYNFPVENQRVGVVHPPDLDTVLPVEGTLYNPVPFLATAPDGKTVVAVAQINGASGGTATGTVFFIINGQISGQTDLPFMPVFAPVFSTDGAKVYISGRNFNSLPLPEQQISATYVFDVKTGQMLTQLSIPKQLQVEFSGYENNLAYEVMTDAVGEFEMVNQQIKFIIVDPDRSIVNQQLIVIRRQFFDQMLILQGSNQGSTTGPNALLSYTVVRATPSVSAVVNSATYQSPVAPGNWASLFGYSLAWQPTLPDPAFQQQNLNAPFPTELGGVRVAVEINGRIEYAPLNYVGPDQINFLVPADAPLGTVTAIAQVVDANGNWISTNSFSISVSEFAPGIYAQTNSQGAVLTGDNYPVSAEDAVVLYGAGLGPTSTNLSTGQPAPFKPLAVTTASVVVTVGGLPAQVLFSGLTPGLVGVSQVNYQIPSGLASGQQQVTVCILNTCSPTSPLLIH